MIPEGDLSGTHFLAALLGISEMVAGLTDREEVLGTIVRITPQLVGMDRCAILLYDEPRREFRTAVVHGPDRERNAVYERLTITEAEARALAHRILEQKLPALVRESMFPRQIAGPLGIKMALVVPLVCRDRTLGIMIIDHTTGQRPFTSKEINVVMGVAQQAAIAVDNFRLQEDARRAREGARLIGELFADGVLTLTQDLRLIALDPAAERLLQWTTSEVVGKGLGDAFGVTGRDGTRLSGVHQVAERDLRSGSGRPPPELYFVRKDGSRVLCAALTTQVRDEHGETTEILCVLRKIPATQGAEPAAVTTSGTAAD
ncbi:MAG TPA: GAF domain-containing protein [Thermoplasmata archaeon]